MSSVFHHNWKGQAGQILRQAWPVLVGSWAGIAFGVLDTVMVGHSSPIDLQAMGLGVSIYITVFIGLMGVIHALIPIIAQQFGARRLTEVGRWWGQGVWLALLLTLIGTLALAFPNIWLSWSGDLSPEVHDRVTWYLRSLILALPASLVFRTIYCLGTATSRPKAVMLINLFSVAFKALFNWMLIFGKFGLPAMGAVGSGLATTVVSWLMLAAGLWLLRTDRFYKPFSLRLGLPSWAAQRELLRLGLPMGGSYLIEICAFSFMALLVAREGVFASGAHQIMANLAAVCFMVPMAVGVAAASVSAQAIGAGQYHRARHVGMLSLGIVLAGVTLTISLLVLLRPTLANAYTDDADVALRALLLLQLLPFFHFCDAFQCLISYLLRAYKVAFVPMLLQFFALSVLGLGGGWWLGFGPAAGSLEGVIQWLAPGAPVGAASLWTMSSLGLGASALLLLFWYSHILRIYNPARRKTQVSQ